MKKGNFAKVLKPYMTLLCVITLFCTTIVPISSATGSITQLLKNPACPLTTSLEWNLDIVPGTTYAYTDRSWYPLGFVSADLSGATLIRMPLNDVRLATGQEAMQTFMNANNTYFCFTPNRRGTIYAIANERLGNYKNGTNGWTTINDGQAFYPATYNGVTYTNYNKYLDGNGVEQTTTNSSQYLPAAYQPTAVTTISRYSSASGGTPLAYKFVYSKSFNAGVTVDVPTVSLAKVGGSPEGAIYVIKWDEVVLSKDDTLSSLSYNGNAISSFSSNTTSYNVTIPFSTSSVTLQGTPTDDGASITYEPQTLTAFPGSATATVTAEDGITTKQYSVYFTQKGTITQLEKTFSCPINTALEWNLDIIPGTTYTYTDRSWFPLGLVSENLIGGTLIRMPLNDVRLSTGQEAMETFMNADNTYFSFTADTKGTIYTVANERLNNYKNGANGWSIMNDGQTFYPVIYNGITYTNYNKYLDGDGVEQTIADTNQYLPAAYQPTSVTTLSRYQNGSPTTYKFVYAKSFNAGDVVNVPTVSLAKVGGSPDGAVYVINWNQVILSNVANLSSLSYDNGSGSVAISDFNFNKTQYQVTLPGNSTSVALKGSTMDDGVTVTYEPQVLTAFPGTITAMVTAEDGAATKQYSVSFALDIPSAPNVTADDINNNITGLNLNTMEYTISTDGGASYGAYTSDPLPALGGSKKVKVRIKAAGTNPAGAEAILTFTPNHGDVSADGVIDISDVIMAAEIAVGYSGYTDGQIKLANVSNKQDMTVDISDVVIIAERAVGGAEPFPVDLP